MADTAQDLLRESHQILNATIHELNGWNSHLLARVHELQRRIRIELEKPSAGVAAGHAIQHCQDCGYDNPGPFVRNNCPHSGGHELLDGPRRSKSPAGGPQDARG